MPKKLKLGVSAAWEEDSSGWGNGHGSEDNWGNFSDNWNGTSDAAGEWGSAQSGWGGGGWGPPAPDLTATDLFPSLQASKPASKRPPPAPDNVKRPADFASILLGAGRGKGGSSKPITRLPPKQDNQTSWSQGSTWGSSQPRANTKSSGRGSTKLSGNYPGQYSSIGHVSNHGTVGLPKQPAKSFGDIFKVPAAPVSRDVLPATNSAAQSVYHAAATPSSTRPPIDISSATRPPIDISTRPPIDLPTANIDLPTPAVDTLRRLETEGWISEPEEDVAEAPRKPIYVQLQEQLMKLSSPLSRPLVYIIQNDSITVEIAGQLGEATKGWTQKDLSQRINEKPQIVAEYESGKAIPNNQIQSKMERILGKSG